jgi:hypothetical protein
MCSVRIRAHKVSGGNAGSTDRRCRGKKRLGDGHCVFGLEMKEGISAPVAVPFFTTREKAACF